MFLGPKNRVGLGTGLLVFDVDARTILLGTAAADGQ